MKNLLCSYDITSNNLVFHTIMTTKSDHLSCLSGSGVPKGIVICVAKKRYSHVHHINNINC